MRRVKLYQKAYEKILNNIKSNSNILGIIVYGSIVTGDIWEESDIDFMVITKDLGKEEIIYTNYNGIYAHINYISKDNFVNNYKKILKGGTFHKAFSSSKLVYSIDDDIKYIYQSTRFYGEKDRNLRNIDILCEILNLTHYAKKFYHTKKYETAYELVLLIFKNYTRINMNINGHITDKDSISIAVNMDSYMNSLFNVIIGELPLKEKITYILNEVDNFLNLNIEKITIPIIEFIKKSEKECSVRDIQFSNEFKVISKDLSLVIHEMKKSGILIEKTRRYTTENGEFLIDEIVYTI